MIKILHIMGETANRGILEILVINPEDGVPAEDYVRPSDDIQEVRIIELEGDWRSCPSERAFEYVNT